MTYELFYLVGEVKEPDLPKIKESVKKMVESESGKWLEPEISEKRKMAYKIKGQFRGIYVAQRFELPEKDTESHKLETVQNISKQIKLNPNILRFVIIKADDLPELKSHEMDTRSKVARSFAGRKEKSTYLKKPVIEKIAKKEAAEEKPTGSKEAKSIDEKLEEILNI